MNKQDLLHTLKAEADHANDLAMTIELAVNALEKLPDWLVGDEPEILERRISGIRRALSVEIATGAFDEEIAREVEAAFFELERFG